MRPDGRSHSLPYENTFRFLVPWKWLWYASGDIVPGIILAIGGIIVLFRKWGGNGARTGFFLIGCGKTEPVTGLFSIRKDTIRKGVLYL
jgi:hypothetical protein